MPIKPERLEEAARRLREEANAAPGSAEEYIRKKLEAARAAALEKSRTRTEPAVPIVYDQESRDAAAGVARLRAENVYNDLQQMSDNYFTGLDYVVLPGTFGQESIHGGTKSDFDGSGKHVDMFSGAGYVGENDSDAYNHWRLAMLREAKKQESYAEALETDPTIGVPGLSCIYTATDNYGDKSRVSGNMTFYENPGRYGFIQIPFEEAEPGDIVQDALGGVPHHAMLLNSTDPSGYNRYNYSSGGAGANALNRNALYYPQDESGSSRNAFRFVGTPADSLRWRNEWEAQNGFRCGGKKFEEGGEEKKGWKENLNDWARKKAIDLYYRRVFKPAIKDYGLDDVRLRLYDHVTPFSYNNAKDRVEYALATPPLSDKERDGMGYDVSISDRKYRDDIWRRYLGVPAEKSHLRNRYDANRVVESKYRPTIGGDHKKYYTINSEWWEGLYSGGKDDQLVNEALFGERDVPYTSDNSEPLSYGETRTSNVLGRYFGDHTISRGVDPERGDYVSFYDLWDLAPSERDDRKGTADESHGIGTPIPFYDRLYLDDYFGVDSRPKDSDSYYGGYLVPAVVGAERVHGQGGKLFYEGGDKFQARDNTRVSSVVPSDLGYVPALYRPLPVGLGDGRWDEGVNGALPVIGDVLQGAEAVRQARKGNLVDAVQTASLILGPNIAARTLGRALNGSVPGSYKGVPGAVPVSDVSGTLERLAYEDVLSGGNGDGLVPARLLGKEYEVPSDAKRVVWNSSLPRLLNYHSEDEVYDAWRKAMPLSATYKEYPVETYRKAGAPPSVAGHYRNGNIGIVEGAPKMQVLPHEIRHKLDAKLPLTDAEKAILRDAFGQEFLDLSNTVPAFDGFSMEHEMVTTNLDARKRLIGEENSKWMGVAEQNALIDKATDDEIISAIENANGYGREFIEALRKSSGVIKSDRIAALRKAMKNVGVFAGLGYLGNALYNGYGDSGDGNSMAYGGYLNGYSGGGRYFRTPGITYTPSLLSPYPSVPSIPAVSTPVETLQGAEAPVDFSAAFSVYTPTMVDNYMPAIDVPVLEEPLVDLFSDERKAYRRLKQRYAESKFNDSAKSHAGARGAWQIMPITYRDYLGRGRGKAGDLNNPEYNGKIRDWMMRILPAALQEFWSEDDSDMNKLAKLYAAYNWGAGNLRNYLRKRQKAGKSIDDPYEWVEGLNPETKRYVKYLAFDEDFDEKTGYTTKQFEDAARKRGYMAEGGRLYGMGGPKKWIKNAISGKIAKEMSEYSKGFLSVDEAKTILEHPDDYASYLGWDDKKIDELKKNFYNNFSPWGYDLLSGLDALTGGEGQEYPLGTSLSEKMARDYLIANYLGIPEKDRKEPLASRMYEQSPYKPTIGSSDSKEYIRYSTDYNRNKIVDIYNGLMSNMKGVPGWKSEIKPGKEYWTSYLDSPYSVTVGKSGKNLAVSHRGTYDFNIDPYSAALGQYTLGYGTDAERGDYISVYDKWDLNPFNLGSAYNLPKKLIKTFASLGDASGGFGNPINFYDRVYLDDYYGVNSSPQNPDEFYGGYIIPATITAERKANGGKIHIKPENRGKFTALKKRTGHSASWFKAHGTPAQKKMAVFALNSKHWSHKRADGGFLQSYNSGYELGKVYDLSEEQVQELIRQGYEVERV